MDAEQRQAVAAEIARHREAQGLSARALADLAGISETTMTKVSKGMEVHPGTLKKVRDALGIEDLTVTVGESYPVDVELVRDAIGMVLMEIAPTDRADVVRRLIRAITDSKG